MTLAVLFALKRDQWKLTTESLYYYYKTLYEETIAKFGVERAGYGGISKLLTAWQAQGYDVFKAELLKSMLTVKKNDAGDDAPGNATVMRVCPIIFSPPDLLIPNALVNALSTKPHGYTLFSSVALALAGEFLVLRDGNPLNVISHTLAKMHANRHTIHEFVETYRASFMKENNIAENGDVEYLNLDKCWAHFEHLTAKLKEVDQMLEPRNPDLIDATTLTPEILADSKNACAAGGRADPIDGINYHALAAPYASPLKHNKFGLTGLGAKCEQTLMCAMFCLKWNRNTTLLGNIVRVNLFGGDTDTLGACVLPYIYSWHKQQQSLPQDCQWIFDGLEMYSPDKKTYGFSRTVFENLVK